MTSSLFSIGPNPAARSHRSSSFATASRVGHVRRCSLANLKRV
jgi:hypothetical protein